MQHGQVDVGEAPGKLLQHRRQRLIGNRLVDADHQLSLQLLRQAARTILHVEALAQDGLGIAQ
ncbi:hypothetical protein D3C75_1255440 [compost metagenome]